MTQVNRLMTNICSTDIPKSKVFYSHLFDLNINFDSDWFVQLTAKDNQLELGIIDRNSELVPEGYRKSPGGVYITMVVDDVEEVFRKATIAGYTIVQSPHDTSYGQRRMLIEDPDGLLVDVSAPIPNFSFNQ